MNSNIEKILNQHECILLSVHYRESDSTIKIVFRQGHNRSCRCSFYSSLSKS